MSEERKKILEMLSEGILTVDEANELLDSLPESEVEKKEKNAFGQKLKDDLQKTKEEFHKAKEDIKIYLDKLDLKEKAKKGYEKADDALRKADEELLKFGRKVKRVFTEDE